MQTAEQAFAEQMPEYATDEQLATLAAGVKAGGWTPPDDDVAAPIYDQMTLMNIPGMLTSWWSDRVASVEQLIRDEIETEQLEQLGADILMARVDPDSDTVQAIPGYDIAVMPEPPADLTPAQRATERDALGAMVRERIGAQDTGPMERVDEPAPDPAPELEPTRWQRIKAWFARRGEDLEALR